MHRAGHAVPGICAGATATSTTPVPLCRYRPWHVGWDFQQRLVGASGTCAAYDLRYGVPLQPQHVLFWRKGRTCGETEDLAVSPQEQVPSQSSTTHSLRLPGTAGRRVRKVSACLHAVGSRARTTASWTRTTRTGIFCLSIVSAGSEQPHFC